MNRVYTNEEYADLWEHGRQPENVMTIVGWAWNRLPADTQREILKTQPVVLIDHPHPEGEM